MEFTTEDLEEVAKFHDREVTNYRALLFYRHHLTETTAQQYERRIALHQWAAGLLRGMTV